MAQASKVSITQEERAQLKALARSRSLPHGLVRRAQIVLGLANRLGSTEITRRQQVSRPTIDRWRKRWCESGIAGLHTALRSGLRY